MAVDPNTLKPYQRKLYDLVKDVKEGETINSGTPSMPGMTKKDYDALISDVKGGKRSIVNDERFKNLTGVSHESLLLTWSTNPTFTTCNSLIGICGGKMGVGTFTSLEPVGGAPSSVSLGQFEIATILAARGMSHAWVPVESGARPQYGDIFRAAEYHMGVCLDFEGDTWNTIEAGQGGRGTGVDKLKRKSQPWGSRAILGWVDVETLLAEKTSAPPWLGGWWKVTEGSTLWYYYFDSSGAVYSQGQEPISRLAKPSILTAWVGSYNIVARKYQTVEIRWFDSDPDERFQVATSTVKIPDTQINDATKDTLIGTTLGRAGGGKPVKGNRLPGAWQTGLTYDQSHPHGGSGDSTARAY